jgi:hypothetical protein
MTETRYLEPTQESGRSLVMRKIAIRRSGASTGNPSVTRPVDTPPVKMAVRLSLSLSFLSWQGVMESLRSLTDSRRTSPGESADTKRATD